MKIAACITPKSLPGPEGIADMEDAFISALPSGTSVTHAAGKIRVHLPPEYVPVVKSSVKTAPAIAKLLQRTERGLGCALLVGERQHVLGQATDRQNIKAPILVSNERRRGSSFQAYYTALKKLTKPFNSQLPFLVIVSRPSEASNRSIALWNHWKEWLLHTLVASGEESRVRVVDLSELSDECAEKALKDLHYRESHILGIFHNKTYNKNNVELEVGRGGRLTLEQLNQYARTSSALRVYWTCESVGYEIYPAIRAIRTTGTMFLTPDAHRIALATLLASAWGYNTPSATVDAVYDRINVTLDAAQWVSSQEYPTLASCSLVKSGATPRWYCVTGREFNSKRIPDVSPRSSVSESELADALNKALGNVWGRDAAYLAVESSSENSSLLFRVTHDGDLLLGANAGWIEEGERQWQTVRTMAQWTLLVEPGNDEPLNSTGLRVRCLVRPAEGENPVSGFSRGLTEIPGKELAVVWWPDDPRGS